MTIAAALSASIITDTGRDIAARVAAMVERAGLPIEDALATAAEIGLTQGRIEGVKMVHARLSNQARQAYPSPFTTVAPIEAPAKAKYGELPR